ncbi:MAG: type II secretion system F family protein [Zetaproteobacteria bacterium]|nr:MAG: type II secretion system F family protein [Zetaproteobacteria bacterium]
MPEFRYEGRTRDGRVLKGELEAPNRDVAAAMLRRQGLVEFKVRKKPKEIEIFPEKPTEKDITVFLRQLATMINAGIPLVQAFELGERGAEKKSMRKLLGEVRKDLEEGNPLADALRKHPEYFDRLTVALVRAGEQGGILDSILLRLAEYKEKTMAIKGKVKSAMVYPISIIVVAFVVTAILMIFVIPQFAEMFKDFGAELPGPTKVTIAISHAFVEYWYLVFGAPVALVLAIRQIYKTPQGRYQLDRLLLNLPVLGDVLRKAAVARFSRTFGTLIAAGVPILEAMDTVAETAGNVIVEEVIKNAKGAIQEGQSLVDPLEASGIFPVMVTQMIRIGEESGALEEMLNKIADFYEQEVDAAVEAMSSLMEPFIMAFLGVVIGGLVISMYLPIFQMAAVVGG